MGKVIVGMTISLDGFVQDRDGSVGALYPHLDTLRDTEPLREAIQLTGAVVMGWNAFAMAQDPDFYAGNHEFQVPIFVLTHAPPQKWPKETDQLTFTFVTDGIESAITQAKVVAGRKDVAVIGGASTAMVHKMPNRSTISPQGQIGRHARPHDMFQGKRDPG